MIAILLAFTLIGQGAAGLTSDNGTIAGMLKTSVGTPAVGVRVTAMAAPDSTRDAASSSAMVSLSETGIDGRYRLENIPPGRYYITAGSVDYPTYFPGTIDLGGGTVVSVTAKANLSGMDFVMQDSSIRLASTMSPQQSMAIPVQVIVDGGGKQPVSAFGQFVTLGFTRTADGARGDIRLDSSNLNAPIPFPIAGAQYRVTVDNLPDGYVLKSMTYGPTDLLTNPLQTPTVAPLLSAKPAFNLTITLATAPPSAPPPAGARISGRMPFRGGGWLVYRDDEPGFFYADGSFELRGVPSGRHIVLMQSAGTSPQYYASLVNIGDRDVDGVTLDNAGVLPTNLIALPAEASGKVGVGSFRPLAGLFGRAMEEDGTSPLTKGSVTILSRNMATIPIGSDGQFVIPHMLPGSYDLRIEAFEHFTLYETVVVRDEDVREDFVVRSANAGPLSDPLPETPVQK